MNPSSLVNETPEQSIGFRNASVVELFVQREWKGTTLGRKFHGCRVLCKTKNAIVIKIHRDLHNSHLCSWSQTWKCEWIIFSSNQVRIDFKLIHSLSFHKRVAVSTEIISTRFVGKPERDQQCIFYLFFLFFSEGQYKLGGWKAPGGGVNLPFPPTNRALEIINTCSCLSRRWLNIFQQSWSIIQNTQYFLNVDLNVFRFIRIYTMIIIIEKNRTWIGTTAQVKILHLE